MIWNFLFFVHYMILKKEERPNKNHGEENGKTKGKAPEDYITVTQIFKHFLLPQNSFHLQL